MCILQIHAQSCDRFLEVLPDQIESVELTVENAVCYVLLDLFGEGTIDDVTIHFSPSLRTDLRYCTIQIHAQCACQFFMLLPRTRENIKLAVEKSMYALLKELFGVVNVDDVTLIPTPWDYGNDSTRL
jgi:hypothetical protein